MVKDLLIFRKPRLFCEGSFVESERKLFSAQLERSKKIDEIDWFLIKISMSIKIKTSVKHFPTYS
jgi:hypothetical protein